MADLLDFRRIAALAAEPLLRYPWRVWFWGDSIGLEGLLDAADLTGDYKYLGFVHGLLKGWIAREHSRSEFDYTAPGVALLRAHVASRDCALLDAARRHAEYLLSFRRTSGAFVRYENAAIELPPVLPPEHPEFRPGTGDSRDGGPCIFVDSIHFDGPFFARLFAVTGERRYRDMALDNILPQIELLYDPAERCFHHFWMERSRAKNGVLWARGNGWALLGIAMTLEDLGPDAPDAAPLRRVLQDGVARVATLQDPSGAWHTILNDPGSYLETSTAAFFADVIARAIRLGIVASREYAEVMQKALGYALARVDSAGVLRGVSYETFPSTDPDHYRSMPRDAVVPWGQGPLLGCLRSYAELQGATGAPSEAAHAER